MGLTKGADAIEQREKDMADARKAAYASDRIDYFSVKDGETGYIRLLTAAEDWIFVAQHSFVQTKPQPADFKGSKWPTAMGAVCRNDVGVREELGLPKDDCYICTNKLQSGFRKEFAKPSPRVWALAALRFQVRGDGTEEKGGPELRGKSLGYDDVMEEYKLLDKDGKPTEQTAERIKIVLVNMTYKQIFATLKHADMNYPGGVMGRDFAIRRVGEGTDTEYQVLAIDPTEEADGQILKPGSPGWKRYEQVLADREVNLTEIVLKQASDEHYARWFDRTKQVGKDGKVVPVEGATITDTSAEVFKGEYPPADDDSPMTEEQRAKIASLRQRLTDK